MGEVTADTARSLKAASAVRVRLGPLWVAMSTRNGPVCAWFELAPRGHRGEVDTDTRCRATTDYCLRRWAPSGPPSRPSNSRLQ